MSSSKRHIVDAEHADAEKTDLPNFSRVQILCRKGTISTEHFGELVKIEKEEVAQNVATSVVFKIDFLSTVDYSASKTPVFTSAGAIVLKAISIIGYTKDNLSLKRFPLNFTDIKFLRVGCWIISILDLLQIFWI